jgi:hypothetical protein
MTKREPTYRIDPIEPDQIGPRLTSLLDRLAPLLAAGDVAALRTEVEGGAYGAAFERLDGLTDDGSVTIDTATLVELVLLGQAIRAAPA